MNNKKIFLTTILIMAFVFGMFSHPLGGVAAASPDPSPNASLQTGCKITNGQEICTLDNPLEGNKTEVAVIIGAVIKAALGIIGALTLLMLVWGGFQWLTSAGNPEKVKSGTQTMVWAIIGVILVFASYILLSTFTDYLTGKT
jgi:hypothetical protein